MKNVFESGTAEVLIVAGGQLLCVKGAILAPDNNLAAFRSCRRRMATLRRRHLLAVSPVV